MEAQDSQDDTIESIEKILSILSLLSVNAFRCCAPCVINPAYAHHPMPVVPVDRKAAILGERLIRKFKSSFLSSQLD